MASKESKLEEEILLHKESKKFLDLLAIASKVKKPVNQKKRNRRKTLMVSSVGDQSALSHLIISEQERDGSTFLTQTGQNANSGKKSTM